MTAERETDTDVGNPAAGDEDRVAGTGDDERENRQEIGGTGEPQRDALGNADGAS